MPDRRDVLKASGASAFTSIVPFTSSAKDILTDEGVERVDANFLSIRFGVTEKPENERVTVGTRSNIPHIAADDGVYLPLHYQSANSLNGLETVISSHLGIDYNNPQRIEMSTIPVYSPPSGKQEFLSNWSPTSPIEYRIENGVAVVQVGELRVDVRAGSEETTSGRVTVDSRDSLTHEVEQFNARLSVNYYGHKTVLGHQSKEIIPADSHQGRLAQRVAQQSSVTLSSGGEGRATPIENINGFVTEKSQNNDHPSSSNVLEIDSLSDIGDIPSSGTTVVAFKTREFPPDEGWDTVDSLTNTAASIWNDDIKQYSSHELNITKPYGLPWRDLPHVPDEITEMREAVEYLKDTDIIQETLSVADATCVIDGRNYPDDDYDGMAYETPSAGTDEAVCLVSANRDGGLLTAHEITHLYGGDHEYGSEDGSTFTSGLYDHSIMGTFGGTSCYNNEHKLYRDGRYSPCTGETVRGFIDDNL